MCDFYNLGPVPLSSAAYVSREFEERVSQEVLAGRWVLLLGPRQHGKSSGIARFRSQLDDAGLSTAVVDLEGLPPCRTYTDLLRDVARRLRGELVTAGDEPPEEDREDLLAWLRCTLPEGNQPVVIIIDEAASIENRQFRNSFYGQIRQITALRANADTNAVEARVRFVFCGMFRPEDLVQEQNSPFNVCSVIRTDDLTRDQAQVLAEQVCDDVVPVVDHAYSLVGGQPFLLQTIFKEAQRYVGRPTEEMLNSSVEGLRAAAEPHLEGIISKVVSNQGLRTLVSGMLASGAATYAPGDGDCKFLVTLGLARQDRSTLVFRNQFYADIVRQTPQLNASAAQDTPTPRIYPLPPSQFDYMPNPQLRDIARNVYLGGVASHNSCHYRLAIVGFGSAMEALLLDFLLTLNSVELNAAVVLAEGETDDSKRVSLTRSENRNNPKTWNLVNLIKVAAQRRVGDTSLIGQAVRRGRNLVHPAAAIRSFLDETHLKPESSIAAEHIEILIRDIRRALNIT